MSKSHRSLCVSFSKTDAGLCIYLLFVWSNFHFLHISQWITLPTQPYLVLYTFSANLLHSLIMWLMVSSPSLHNLLLLFCCVLSILALIWMVLTAFCAAISLWVIVSMHPCCLQCWQCSSSLFSCTYSLSNHLWDVMPYAWSLVFLFFGSFV